MSGVWGIITDSDWTNEDATVVCRKLGHFRPGKYTSCLLVCPCSSAGRAICLDCRVSWVRVPLRAAHYFFERKCCPGCS